MTEIYIYRMTHIQNIPHILNHGLTTLSSPNNNPDYIAIGSRQIIKKRERSEERIPFYFCKKSPMLYCIQNGHYVSQKTSPHQIVYLVSSISILGSMKVNYFFTDGHLLSGNTKVFSKDRINDIYSILDFNAINAIYWNDNSEIKRKKEAECVVEQDLPLHSLIGFIVYNKDAFECVSGFVEEAGFADLKAKIKIDSKAYF
ncbi:MAG: DUF4433 domain-containing protein [Methylacidiphilales bacterium]|nr:DUF4433 domain-containing protein [Candidatus Methylacidiphilales bacterium]